MLFVVDCREGTVPLDQEVAKRLRYVSVAGIRGGQQGRYAGAGKPGRRVLSFRRKIVRVSALENRGKSDLLDAIYERLPDRRPKTSP